MLFSAPADRFFPLLPEEIHGVYTAQETCSTRTTRDASDAGGAEAIDGVVTAPGFRGPCPPEASRGTGRGEAARRAFATGDRGDDRAAEG
ncbi:MAG: hypothetical protein ACRD2Z_12690, partial [Thermoanaerobaculia bacterium]